MHRPPGLLAGLVPGAPEGVPVLIIPEDRLAPVAPAYQVAAGTRKLDSQGSRQGVSAREYTIVNTPSRRSRIVNYEH
jgi:hypothetical protein